MASKVAGSSTAKPRKKKLASLLDGATPVAPQCPHLLQCTLHFAQQLIKVDEQHALKLALL
jgi:hypothetical protein